MKEKDRELEWLGEALAVLKEGFSSLPPSCKEEEEDEIRTILLETARRLRDNFPYHHPLYCGQMLKPPHAIARLAYMLSLWINPNNHALDGGRATSAMEKEAISKLADMLEWENHLGHLCSGGTVANMEALWVAGRLHPGQTILASQEAHYTHRRIAEVLGLPFETIPSDSRGRMEVGALKKRLAQGGVGTVVATLGTTALGALDPLHEIGDLRRKMNFRLHVDAAYGGYFTLAENLAKDARKAYDHLPQVDSVVIDPHKHGLQPYGCGSVLFRDPSVGHFYQHDSPYTYFTSTELHLGEISLECSRPGAAAAALWATLKLFPLERGGVFARQLEQSRQAALKWHEKLSQDDHYLTSFPPELDILFWTLKGKSASEISKKSRLLFEAAAREDLHLALFNLSAPLVQNDWDIDWDQEEITCLRSCMMKKEHLLWLEEMKSRLDRAREKIS